MDFTQLFGCDGDNRSGEGTSRYLELGFRLAVQYLGLSFGLSAILGLEATFYLRFAYIRMKGSRYPSAVSEVPVLVFEKMHNSIDRHRFCTTLCTIIGWRKR
ncbi:MAG: hypothetical protein ABJF07_10650 [Nisaea sp.]|uniref:hypothetical protein n=1 Tax=Nisaea sp. TaxID=2024842 RepID=UPI003263A17A